MTDRERLEALFRDLGIGVEIREVPEMATVAIVLQPFAPKVFGRSDSLAAFTFDKAGNFMNVVVGE
ncbi:hypothetical protein [Streptomyces hoynatensis]|uniref:Uncharacterized protein n=1 Tax=Streptomyces hoynatensis TaxID=1141874 RepID=A0A3A9YMY8_9ACTN|nr:hypothetical protein [Streptomyces hoynatensis]RKN35956.1 hypothetical protein D7294_30465 [Streptomyces hoynatensis]